MHFCGFTIHPLVAMFITFSIALSKKNKAKQKQNKKKKYLRA